MSEEELEQITDQFMKLMLQLYYQLQKRPQTVGRFKLNSLSFNVLFRIYANREKSLTILDLTQEMQISKPQLSKLINNLEDANLVMRERFKENRRLVYLSLSPDGMNYIERTLTGMKNGFREKLAVLGNDRQEDIAEGILKITKAMEP